MRPLTLPAIILALSAGAASAEDRRLCQGEGNPPPEDRAAACTRIINAGEDQGSSLAEAHYERGIAHLRLRELARAQADFSRAIELDPGQPRFFFGRGRVYTIQGDRVRAVAEYDRAIELEPRYFDALYERGIVSYSLRQFDRAAADFGRAIEINPGSVPAHISRGRAHAQLGRREDAIADFRKALSLRPEEPAALAGLRNLGAEP